MLVGDGGGVGFTCEPDMYIMKPFMKICFPGAVAMFIAIADFMFFLPSFLSSVSFSSIAPGSVGVRGVVGGCGGSRRVVYDLMEC